MGKTEGDDRFLRTVILASASPRRAMLLDAAGVSFVVDACPLPELAPQQEGVRWHTACIAIQKALYAAARHPDGIIVAADTVVVLDGVCLGKPRDAAHACRMLEMLSGRTHSVLTGVCLMDMQYNCQHVFVRESYVQFDTLSPQWIAQYVASGEPMDKAGAYAIQGGAGEKIITIQGDYDSIVGLPVCDVVRWLQSRSEAK